MYTQFCSALRDRVNDDKICVRVRWRRWCKPGTTQYEILGYRTIQKTQMARLLLYYSQNAATHVRFFPQQSFIFAQGFFLTCSPSLLYTFGSSSKTFRHINQSSFRPDIYRFGVSIFVKTHTQPNDEMNLLLLLLLPLTHTYVSPWALACAHTHSHTSF